MKLDPVLEGDRVVAEGYAHATQGGVALLPVDEYSGQPDLEWPLPPPLANFPASATATYVHVEGVWRDTRADIWVDFCAPGHPDVSEQPLLTRSPSKQRVEELWGVWTQDDPPPVSQLGLDVVAFEVTNETVEITCFNHSRARAVLAPHYGSTLRLHHPPFEERQYLALRQFCDVAETEGVLQAVGWGLHPPVWLQRVTPVLAGAASQLQPGLPLLTIQVTPQG